MSKFMHIPEEDRERARRAAAKEMAPALQYIRFNNVDFILIGNANTPGTSASDTSWIAASDQACVVYNLYQNSRVADSRRYNMVKLDDPGRPNTIDKDQWEKDPKTGEPKNPWGRALELPLLRLGDDGMPDGQTVVLQASAKPLRAQVGKLIEDYTTTLKRQHVTLIVEDKYQPEIRITGYSDDESDLLEFDGGFDGDSHNVSTSSGNVSTNTGNAGSRDNISTGSAPKKKNDDIDDDIPF
jgi:hypothetical protein